MGRPAPAWLTPTPDRLGKPPKSRASARPLIKNEIVSAQITRIPNRVLLGNCGYFLRLYEYASRGVAEGRIVTSPRPDSSGLGEVRLRTE